MIGQNVFFGANHSCQNGYCLGEMYIQKKRESFPLSVISIRDPLLEIRLICSFAGYDSINVNAFYVKEGI